MLVHGVSLSLRFWQARHPPRYAAYLIPSSPSFPHSSENRLFARSDGGGRTWATIATRLQPAKMNNVDPLAFLNLTVQLLPTAG
ncbi:hypothetical protein NK6_2245 [Bradyrhizobium diazoefficiens]|uniref:Uncharacterized protein n=1 Tax=Bradyrhizobium diazoefficiens TaxID=1355477 RepID=A0A0E4BMQ8_9BRAD|nr:hypothetical protein NK6_2245 [Bradyrhizobium diazoefficiens]